MEKTTYIEINESRLRFIESKYNTKLLNDVIEIHRSKYPFHINSLTTLLMEVGVPLIYTSAIMRMNRLKSTTLPDSMGKINIIGSSIIDEINKEVLSIKIEDTISEDSSPIL